MVTSFPDEIEHLAHINQNVEEALQNAEGDVTRRDQEYKDAKHYMAEYRNELDAHEKFQNERLLEQTDRMGVFSVEMCEKLKKIKESPYFARIDFKDAYASEPEKFYIGRFSFVHNHEMKIIDWRSPIASMFYDDELGTAGYQAPVGRIDGELTKKRQYKIKNGMLEFVLESADNVQDDVLQKELSLASDERMKTIITTIQKEQNAIIRNEKSKTLIIQGVAGSGKTSVALHRVAFLLYRFKGQIQSSDVMILSPNKVFSDYISSVIPELGEEPIREMSFAEIAQIELKDVITFEEETDPLENHDETWRKRVAFKSTYTFWKSLEKYMEEISERIFLPKEYSCGKFIISREFILNRFQAHKKLPILRRMTMVAEDISYKLRTDNISEKEFPNVKAIERTLLSMLRWNDTMEIYKDFYDAISKAFMLYLPNQNSLEWADVFPFLYIKLQMEGLKEPNVIKHLVIDEMQDYTPIQYAVINEIFSCSKTLLGDFGQFLNSCHKFALEDMKKMYPEAEFVELNKSYRSSYEIMSFAKEILQNHFIEAVRRHGEKTLVISCKDSEEEMMRLKSEIVEFMNGGKESLGIIVKTQKEAEKLYYSLSQNHIVNLITRESTKFVEGISISSIRMAKGLEFDEVIVPDVDNRNYASGYDRNLLYIACTRAMHRLKILYTGEQSDFLPESS